MAAKYLVYGSRGAKYECDTLKEAKKVAGKYGTIEKAGGDNLTGKAISASKAKFKTPYRKNPEGRNDSDEELIETLHGYAFNPVKDGFHSSFSEDAEYYATDYAREQGYDPDDIEVDHDKVEEVAKEFTLDFLSGLSSALEEGLRNYDKEQARNAINAVIDHSYAAGRDLYLTAAGHGAGFWDGGWEEGDLLTEIAQSCGTPEVFDVLVWPEVEEAVQNPRGVSPAATALYNKRPIGSKVHAAGVVFTKVSNDPHRGGAWEVSGNGAGLKDGEIVPGYAVSRAVTAMVEGAFGSEARANPEAKYRAVGTRGGVYETETLRQAKDRAGRFGTVERIGGAADGLAQKARAKSRQHYGVPKGR